ncbi:uncharacterized protein EI90DRAFT_3033263 [Cantharellus anzutake]|uniref:uncharacterized protein n=1 Tax=Cantharellus anzutake TaxID=1750568 RepID=UPI0019042605|nr:uncharacterized protein EI90DRAFT_3033263 [Cantharellus anzutake]KAF8341254.1 hypothetical protein EI90DRAFT_3033263 [Cantharellus anzutake]
MAPAVTTPPVPSAPKFLASESGTSEPKGSGSGFPYGVIVGILMIFFGVVLICPWCIWRRRIRCTLRPEAPRAARTRRPASILSFDDAMFELYQARRDSRRAFRPASHLPSLPRTSAGGQSASPTLISPPSPPRNFTTTKFFPPEGEASECPICLNDVDSADMVEGAPCGHRLCTVCRDTLIGIASRKGETARCHACRHPYKRH